MSSHDRTLGKQEAKAILNEFRALSKRARDENDGLIDDVALLDDKLHVWRIQMSKFDTSIEAGRKIEADLRELERKYGVGHLMLECIFRESFPSQPPLIRVVYPRIRWYHGHVTAGGSICTQMLVNGIENGWCSSYTMEGVIETVKNNFLHAEQVFVRTLTGPGGFSGPLRIDLQHEFCYDVLQEYSSWAAENSFARAVAHHRMNGW